MMIKFPLKLLIWKPFKVDLEFIEIDLSCINLESIQKQSRLDRKIKKIQHCWGKPIKRTLCGDCKVTYLIFVIFFTRAKFLENKIYTEKTRKLRKNTQ